MKYIDIHHLKGLHEETLMKLRNRISCKLLCSSNLL